MQVKIEKTYICDFCKKEYNSKDEAWKCEQSHDIDERLKLIEGSIICPMCGGKGWYYGNDGCDTRSCYDCNGKGVVIPIIETRRVYKRIGEM